MAELFITQLADGAGVPVVLSHALGLDHSMWAGISEMWPGKRPVLVCDHRGHGRSPVTPGPYTMVDLVDDAVQVIEQWGRGPVVWIGLSMGGMVGQGLAIRRPDARAGRGARCRRAAGNGAGYSRTHPCFEDGSVRARLALEPGRTAGGVPTVDGPLH